MYPLRYMYPQDACSRKGIFVSPQTLMHSHALPSHFVSLLELHHTSSHFTAIDHTPSDSNHLQKLEIDGNRSKSIFGGIEGSSREVSARRSRIFGSRPKNLIFEKSGVQKGPGSNFRWSPGRPPKSDNGRSPSLKTESDWLPPVAIKILFSGLLAV